MGVVGPYEIIDEQALTPALSAVAALLRHAKTRKVEGAGTLKAQAQASLADARRPMRSLVPAMSSSHVHGGFGQLR